MEKFSCSCGEGLKLPEAYRGEKLFCFRCRRSVFVPGRQPQPQQEKARKRPPGPVDPLQPSDQIKQKSDSKAEVTLVTDGKEDETPTIEVDTPVHFEWVLLSGGKEYWKLTCPCGKRLLSPAPSVQPYGCCPKCGRRLPLPGYDVSPKVVRVPAREETGSRVSPPEPELREDRTTAFAMAVRSSSDPKINLQAAATAAARLRPSRPSVRNASRTASSRISAWPSAGAGRRLLASFIDLSFGMCVAGFVFALAGPHALEPGLSPLQLLAGLMLLSFSFNDTVVQFLFDGSLGKKLVLIIVRSEDSAPLALSLSQVLLRALLKWLLIPGWILGATNLAEQTLHDKLAKTLVLRGRRHRPGSATQPENAQ